MAIVGGSECVEVQDDMHIQERHACNAHNARTHNAHTMYIQHAHTHIHTPPFGQFCVVVALNCGRGVVRSVVCACVVLCLWVVVVVAVVAVVVAVVVTEVVTVVPAF